MKRIFHFALIIILTLSSTSRVHATHIMGGDLSYRFVGRDTANHMMYKVTLTFYRACCISGCSTSGPNTGLTVKSTCTNRSYIYALHADSCLAGCEISYLCNALQGQSMCNGGNYPGVMKYSESVIITLTDTCNWIISWVDGARNSNVSNLANPDTYNIYLEATINNSIDPVTGNNYVNSAPVFIKEPDPFLCINTINPYVINSSAIDIDGDSLVYVLIDPLYAANTTIPHRTGWSGTVPIHNSYFNFDSTTGLLSVHPIQYEVDVYTVKVSEYRGGMLIGSVMRDVEATMFQCSSALLPSIGKPILVNGGSYGADSNTIHTCAGSNLVIKVPAQSYGHNISNMNSDVQRYPQIFHGVNFSVSGSGAMDTARIEWNVVDTGCRYISVEVRTDDCLVPEAMTRMIRICGDKTTRISGNPYVYCGRQALRLAGSGGGAQQWWPSAGLSDTVGFQTYASPTIPTWYHYSSGCGVDSAYIDVRPALSCSMMGDTSICLGDVQHISVHMNSPGSYTYKWSPSYGLYDTIGGAVRNDIPSPYVRTNESTIYHCTIIDTSGCMLDTSVNIRMKGVGPLSITANTPVVRNGNVTLSLTTPGIKRNSGTLPGASISQNTIVRVGIDTTVQRISTAAYPSPYGNYLKSARHQILFHASELRAMFGNYRIISSLALDIERLNAGSMLNNFTIKLGIPLQIVCLPDMILHLSSQFIRQIILRFQDLTLTLFKMHSYGMVYLI